MPALEREVIARWRERDTMARYLARNENSERRFSFIDGPITANNPMGVHHAWGRTYKDLFQRYHTMLGERQRYQNGFDCQGLWVEVEVERELGFNNKREIEEFGIDRFVEQCKERVAKFAGDPDRAVASASATGWTGTTPTTRTPTRTTTPSGPSWPSATAASCIYKGHDVDAVVPALRHRHQQHGGDRGLRRGEAPVGHHPPPDHVDAGHEDEDLLVWTTTPWTLSSNVAAAVHPALTYQLVAAPDGRRWWVSAGSQRARGTRRRGRAGGARAPSSSDSTYARPVRRPPAAAGVAHRVIPWTEVSDEEGTGIVHIAPGCGQEDFALSKEHGLAVIDPIDEFGIFRAGFGWQTGRYAGAADDPRRGPGARRRRRPRAQRPARREGDVRALATRTAGAAARS